MDLINSVLNLVLPPASLVMLAFAWPALSAINACEWVYNTLRTEDMEDKVVIITGASSGIGEVLITDLSWFSLYLFLGCCRVWKSRHILVMMILICHVDVFTNKKWLKKSDTRLPIYDQKIPCMWCNLCLWYNSQQIAYEYAKRRAKLVLVARRENRLRGIGENARELGAKHVMIMAADVVKLDDCRRFVYETLSYYGRRKSLIVYAS